MEYNVHSYFKSRAVSTLTLGEGEITYMSQKQKLDMKISKEADLLGTDSASSLILCTNLFLEAQGYKAEKHLYQDNKSTIILH